MDAGLIDLIVLSIVIIIGSGLCSGSEAAIFSISLTKAKSLEEEKRRNSKLLLKIIENKERYIFAIVILNNFINILGASLFSSMVSKNLGEGWVSPLSVILTLMIIFFAEVLPKSVGSNNADQTSLAVSRTIYYVEKILYPLTALINALSSYFIKAVFDLEEREFTTSESEIKHIVNTAASERVISSREQDFIKNVFNLNDVQAKDIMTPRTVLTTVWAEDALGDIEDLIDNSPHSRILVIGEDIDDIVGIILHRDLSNAYRKFSLDTKVGDLDKANLEEKLIDDDMIINKSPIIMPETAKAESLLLRFQKRKEHLAIVTDEYGGVAGVVSLEDVLEIIVGEIQDEYDEVVDMQEYAIHNKKQKKIEKQRDSQQELIND